MHLPFLLTPRKLLSVQLYTLKMSIVTFHKLSYEKLETIQIQWKVKVFSALVSPFKVVLNIT